MNALMMALRRHIYWKLRAARHERHVNWLPQAGIAYFRVPKAGNSSVRTALARGFELQGPDALKPWNDGFWRAQPKHIARALSPKAYLRQTRGQDVWSFTLIRHPVHRLYSCYNNKILENETLMPVFAEMGFNQSTSFEAFVEQVAQLSDKQSDLHIRAQSSFLTLDGKLLPDFVGRLENIEQDWQHIRSETRARCGVDLGAMPLKNHRQKRQPEVTQITTPQTLKLIETRYAQDFELLYS